MDSDTLSKFLAMRDNCRRIKDHNGDPAPLRIDLDNQILADENRDFLKWDDTNQLLWIVKQNNELGRESKAKMKIICTLYDNIQRIEALLDTNRAPEFLSSIGFTNVQIANTIDHFDPEQLKYLNYLSPTIGNKAKLD